MTNEKFQITNFQALLFAYPRELLHPAQPSTEGRKYTLVFIIWHLHSKSEKCLDAIWSSPRNRAIPFNFVFGGFPYF